MRRRDRAARCDRRGAAIDETSAIWCMRSLDWSLQDRAAWCDRRSAAIDKTGATGACDRWIGARGSPAIVGLDWSSGFALFFLSLSLSLLVWKPFKVKIGTEMNFHSQSVFFKVK